jgi:hypothetical protein
MKHLFRILLAIIAFIALLPFSAPAAVIASALCLTVTPLNLRYVGAAPAAYPGINAETLADLVSTAGSDVEQVIWELQLILSAAQQSPFADNMTGPEGSGKPIISNTNTSRVAGNQIVFGTLDSLGGPGVQGEGVRVGMEEMLKPGNFRLAVDLQWFGTGMTNKARAQSIPGATYPEKSKFLLARRLAKKQSDDVMQTLKCSATSFNTLVANNKTIDTLSTSDTYQTSLVVASGGLLRDIGCAPMNAAPNPDKPSEKPPRIPHFLSFLTDLGARPIKTEPNYVQAAQLARDRGEDNPLFSGEYLKYDNQIIYAWQNIRHGGWGSIGSALQPEARLGTALGGRTVASGVLPAGSGILDGGGSATAAALYPLPLWFEFWSLYSYIGSNGTTQLYSPHSTTIAYGAIVNSTTGVIDFFSYTGNTGSTLTGVVMAGASTAGNYSAAAIGSVTYGTAPWTTTADGQGFQGISDGAYPSGSLMIECNAKGVPLCFGLPMGEMAAVCGYGNVPVDETLKAMANRTKWTAPHGQAYSYGLEYSWGVAAFKRPDGNTPNFLLNVFARQQNGFPSIS